jgi:hypothetical protein
VSLSLRTILLTACDYYGISAAVMVSDRRTRRVVRPRQVIMWLCRKHTGRSLPAIGNSLGGRDHTTVLHGCRHIDELRETNPEIAEQIADLEGRLKALASVQPEEASELAKRLAAMPGDATLVTPNGVLKMAAVISERDGRLRDMQEHLGAALAVSEQMALDYAEKDRQRAAQREVRKFRVVPAHIIDRDLVA